MSPRVSVELSWPDVDVGDFVRALETQLGLVREVMQAIGVRPDSVRWVIKRLEGGSALAEASCVLLDDEIEDADVERALQVSGAGFSSLEQSSDRPEWFSDKALEFCSELSTIRSPNHAGVARFRFDSIGVTPSPHVAANVEEIVGGRVRSIGSVEGVLQGLIRTRAGYRLTIRARAWHRDITCLVPREMRKQALDAFEQRVIVRGELWSRRDGSPQQIEARDIEVIPPDDELPGMREVWGILGDLRRADGE